METISDENCTAKYMKMKAANKRNILCSMLHVISFLSKLNKSKLMTILIITYPTLLLYNFVEIILSINPNIEIDISKVIYFIF